MELIDGPLSIKQLSRDKEYLNKLVMDTKNSIIKVVMQLGGTLDDAKDVHAATFEILLNLEQQGKLNITTSIHSYINTIAKRYYIKNFKENKIRTTILESNSSSIPSFEMELEEISRYRYFRSMVEKLGSSCKELLERIWSPEKPSMKQIAESFKWSNENVASVRKNECINKLIKIIKADSKYREFL